ncbi:hypothetical protein [Brevundimonas naejangsanensis]|uniref:hypothetical protein n=1 Tax=Brevundimonas naejangsanensis TaxID=588932 RepID=UPI0026EB9FA0|nr:hypothetical protein [Brevundimonas naejangsanensis]
MQTSSGLTFTKFQCLVAGQTTIITWAQSEAAARHIVAEFEGVPLAWVEALAVEG